MQATTLQVMTLDRGWGPWVRAMLDEAGMSQVELANRADVRESTVSRWLSGKTARPSFDVAVQVGVVFGRVPDALRAAHYRPDMPGDENGAAKSSQAM